MRKEQKIQLTAALAEKICLIPTGDSAYSERTMGKKEHQLQNRNMVMYYTHTKKLDKQEYMPISSEDAYQCLYNMAAGSQAEINSMDTKLSRHSPHCRWTFHMMAILRDVARLPQEYKPS